MTTTASGFCTSDPMLCDMAIGSRPSIARRAVISTAASRGEWDVGEHDGSVSDGPERVHKRRSSRGASISRSRPSRVPGGND
jgi:hypothetical protein